ncbi:hypothetical protein HRbin15_00746 [bacterium HR15]|nr:hypothetical protein HRbin15_00746 [bacterium HR15]
MGRVRFQPVQCPDGRNGWIIERVPTSVSEAIGWLKNSQRHRQAWEYLIKTLSPKPLHLLLKQYESDPATAWAYNYIGMYKIKTLAFICEHCVLSESASPTTRAAALLALCQLTDRLDTLKDLCFEWVEKECVHQRLAAATVLCKMRIRKGWDVLCCYLEEITSRSRDYYTCLVGGSYIMYILKNYLYNFTCTFKFASKIINWINKTKYLCRNKNGSYRYISQELMDYFLRNQLESFAAKLRQLR